MLRFSMAGSGLFLGILGYFMYEDWQMKRNASRSRGSSSTTVTRQL